MRGELVSEPFGGLHVWRTPEEGKQYVVAVDTSAGVRDGDFSAAEVVEMESCEQVAEWHGYYDPNRWGYACVRLAYWYNQALLAFETHPSPHGLTAFEAASRYGYDNLHQQTKWDTIAQAMVTRKGFIRTPSSTLVLYDRVRMAMAEKCPIRSAGLLDEAQAMKLDGDKPVSALHNDRLIAYAIALKVRDDAFARGLVVREDKPVVGQAEAYWRRKAQGGTPGREPPMQELEDGS